MQVSVDQSKNYETFLQNCITTLFSIFQYFVIATKKGLEGVHIHVTIKQNDHEKYLFTCRNNQRGFYWT